MAVSAGFMMLLIPGLAAAFLLIFAFPSIVVDGAGPLESLRYSYRLVLSNLKDSFTLFVFIFTIGLMFGMANLAVSGIEVLGQLLGVVISGIFGGYASVVILKTYMVLKKGEATPKDLG
jgi:hypothetical protein